MNYRYLLSLSYCNSDYIARRCALGLFCLPLISARDSSAAVQDQQVPRPHRAEEQVIRSPITKGIKCQESALCLGSGGSCSSHGEAMFQFDSPPASPWNVLQGKSQAWRLVEATSMDGQR